MDDVSTDVDDQGLAATLGAQPDVVAAYLFGSVARGEALPQSDLDIAVLLDSKLDERAMVERQLALMADLEPFSDREVQVVLLNVATPLLAYQVIRDGRCLAARSEVDRVAFEVTAMKRYFDIQPMLAFYDAALFERIREVGLGRGRRRGQSAAEAAERLFARLKESPDR